MDKPLSEYTHEELWQLFPIELKEHNSEYKNWYRAERAALTSLLQNSIIRIHHIGSTSVEGLLAKPTVDILLEISFDTDIEALTTLLLQNDWLLMAQEKEPVLKLSFVKGYTPQGFAHKVFHLHIRYGGDWDELYFKDYLREYPAVANAYAELKRDLLEAYKYNRDAYTEAKTAFISMYTKRARQEYGARYVLDE